MRFVFAIVAFIAAAVMIGFGIAQRTVFLEPDRVTVAASIDEQADYVVIEPAALRANPGKQTLEISGADTVYAAYGRTADVQAWLGDEPYVAVGYDPELADFTTDLRGPGAADGADGADGGAEEPAPTATPAPTTSAPSATPAPTTESGGADAVTATAVSPAGSDLWLDEFQDEARLSTILDAPDGISVLVASGTTAPAPTEISVSWPLDNSTPWAGPLIAAGGLVFLVGLVLVVSGIVRHRRSRGPRRNLPKGPRGMPRASRQPGVRAGRATAGRRAIGRAGRTAALPLVLVPALALSACSAEYWPSFGAAPAESAPATTEPAITPTPTPGADTAADGDVIEPAVTVPQMERIMRRIAVFATDVDAARDGELAAQRFTGPALEARRANYQIRGVLPDQPTPAPIPAGPLTLTLPQQASGWPRTVMTIAQNEDDPTVAPTALVLEQATPRDNYKIVYAMALVPEAPVPRVAPAEVGAPPISPEYKGLVMPPGQVAAAFADVAQNGPASTFAPLFDLEATDLDEALNAQTRKTELEAASPTLTITISTAAGDAPTYALATIDAGALVTVEIQRTEQSRPNDGGTTGFAEGGPASALSGFTAQSAKGVQRTSALQAIFYVPAVGSDEQIQLLGWSDSLIGASEVP